MAHLEPTHDDSAAEGQTWPPTWQWAWGLWVPSRTSPDTAENLELGAPLGTHTALAVDPVKLCVQRQFWALDLPVFPQGSCALSTQYCSSAPGFSGLPRMTSTPGACRKQPGLRGGAL